ncbi:PIN domain [Trypanosoma melophagium]|uniref:PIN domain n=1 Tax=Trypanosoma melophagium TaxID=715481 RepID=UPI00351A02D8|nr:PIN domain [Trypanosoma melophagium]
MPPKSRKPSRKPSSTAAPTTTTTTTTSDMTALTPYRVSPRLVESLRASTAVNSQATSNNTHRRTRTAAENGIGKGKSRRYEEVVHPSNVISNGLDHKAGTRGNVGHASSRHLVTSENRHPIIISPVKNLRCCDVSEEELETGGMVGSSFIPGDIHWNGSPQQNFDFRDETPLIGMQSGGYVVDTRNEEESESSTPARVRSQENAYLNRNNIHPHKAHRAKKDHDHSNPKRSIIEHQRGQKRHPVKKEIQNMVLKKMDETSKMTSGNGFVHYVPTTTNTNTTSTSSSSNNNTSNNNSNHGISAVRANPFSPSMLQTTLFSAPSYLNGLQSRVRSQAGGASFSSSPAVSSYYSSGINSKVAEDAELVQRAAPSDSTHSSRLEEIRWLAEKRNGKKHRNKEQQVVKPLLPVTRNYSRHLVVDESNVNGLCVDSNNNSNSSGTGVVPSTGRSCTKSNSKSASASDPSERSVDIIYFVFDTCSLLTATVDKLNALINCGKVCLPSDVISELDGMNTSKGQNPTERKSEKRRFAARRVRNWIIANSGKGSQIRVQRKCEVEAPYDRRSESKDDYILGFAVYLEQSERRRVVFITEDKFLRVKAGAELTGSVLCWEEVVKEYLTPSLAKPSRTQKIKQKQVSHTSN